MPLSKVASLAITAALTGAQMALNATRRIEGPRLEDLNVTVADYGTPLSYIYGLKRLHAVPIIWAEPIKEEKKKRKTKGGKINEYRYYGTWAVVVTDHEIDAVTRVWFDKHLVYDVTGAGPVSPFTLSKKKNILDVMRIYLGTETQEPDPRMLATVEAKHGAGTCPAYRGVSYIVFEEVPLEKLGNRIPQISVEAVANGAPSYPYETVSTTTSPQDAVRYSPDYSRFFWGGTDYEIWDTASRRQIISGTWTGGGQGYGIATSGHIYGIRSTSGPDGKILTKRDADGVGSPIDIHTFTTSVGYGDLMIRTSLVDDVELIGMIPYSASTDHGWYYIRGGAGVWEEEGLDYQLSSYFSDLDGNIWGVGAKLSTTTLVFRKMYGTYGDAPDYFEVTAPSSEGVIAHTQAFHYRDSAVDHFVVRWDGGNYLLAVDLATQAITITVDTSGGTNYDFERIPPGSSTFWMGTTERSSVTLATIRTYSDSDLVTLWSGSPVDTPVDDFYDPINHALVSQPVGNNQWVWRYLDRVSSSGVTLASIVGDVFARCGIEPGDYDITNLDQIVKGYSWTQGSGKAIIEPLLDFYDSDIYPHDFDLNGLKRGASSAGTIDVGEFVAKGSRYTITKIQDTDLFRRLTLTYADPAGDQQPNTVTVQRALDEIDGIRETAFDLTTLVLDVDEARQGAERFFRRKWNERESYSLTLTAQRMALEPSNVWTLGLDDVNRIARLNKLTFAADDTLGMEWIQDDPSLAGVTSTPGAPQDGRVASRILIPMLVRALILDIPAIKDVDNSTNPLLYYGAGPYGTGLFPGAALYQYDGDGYDLEIAGIGSDSPATWGYATDALPNAAYTVWDRGNSVNVKHNHGTPIAATEAACNANPRLNLAALGAPGRWELLQFTTPTLEVDGSYTYTGLKRGRRGTEWATGLHQIGDTFILMDGLSHLEMGAGDIGNDLSFKMVTLGTEEESAIPTDVDDYSAASNRPWAPAQFEAVKDPSSGDWTLTWRRRSRVAGDFAPYDPPLGESAENYDLKIYRSGFGAAATRTITATSETATYTAAQQVTDGGAVAVGDLDAGVLQVGDLADGYETQVSF